MSKELELKRDFWNNRVPLFGKKNIVLETGVTILVGCNGSGKSTMMISLKESARKEKQCIIEFDNLEHGGKIMKDALFHTGNFESFMELAISSEGENIYSNIGRLFGGLKNQIKKKEVNNLMHKFKEIWIFLDAVDSGLDISGIIDLKQALNTVCKDLTEKGYDVYAIVSANNYELARESNCFDVRACKYITFEDYESYRKFIIDSNNRKRQRYKKINEKIDKEKRS